MSGSITRIRGSNMTDLDLIGMKGKKYQDKVEQSCPSCKLDVLALRINGFYAGSRERIFLWECPSCGSMAQSPTQVEKRAIAAGCGVLKSIDKRRVVNYPTCASNFCIARVNAEGEMCRNCQTSNTTMAKGEFRGYTKNNLAGRAERQAKRRAWEYHARIRER